MLLGMATSSAWAGNDNAKVPADSLHTYQLQTVVVASTRAGNKTPMAFQNVSRKELQSVNFGKDIPYLLSLTPSIITTSDAGNGIGYTTLRVRGTDPTRINITVNGVPQNDAESSGLYWALRPMVPVLSVPPSTCSPRISAPRLIWVSTSAAAPTTVTKRLSASARDSWVATGASRDV